ncbi:hypothetical protein BAUCODRAFT_397284 [Baudoinia panamericana UAMH 10762]|uniref:Zn(2)-C6 fungal-type domain-containing protein n=1 Tax=Baudoinia panamericana (strain UAMH 10762) TaxID=717646 RepID=M2LX67_BAUPA|nr:uncharacterized protein BAUCODRAFT_397284 [Baudoinia panamericana UAMH 10762]EMC99287.1 hypothetical protein BAUCODRAFT_397284 [Baudoinia panamericana UAMH 10762]
MVGRVTSRGCATCRKRKVKCDRAEPECYGCVKAGWRCPGYPDRFVLARVGHDKKDGMKTVHKPQRLNGYAELSPRWMISSNADLLRMEFIWKLEANLLAARLPMMPTTHVLKHVPQRIGQSRALDDAASCIVQQSPDTSAVNSLQGRALYVKALRSLRIALGDPVQLCMPETLTAAAILEMYEQYADQPSHNWIIHAQGVVKMLRYRGVVNISDAIEKAILEAQAGNVFMSALAIGVESFLDHPSWYGILMPSTAPNGHLDKFMRMTVDGARFPGIDDLCDELVRQCSLAPNTPVQHMQRMICSALENTLRLREQLNRQLEGGRTVLGRLDMCDAMATAAYAAIGFFSIITNTVLLGLNNRFVRLSNNIPTALPAGLSEKDLMNERSRTLELVTKRFETLATADPDVSRAAPAALRVMLGTVLGLNDTGVKGSYEAGILLSVLEAELGRHSRILNTW